MSPPAWLVYASSPRVQPPSCPSSEIGAGGPAAGYAAPGWVIATLSRLTLQPSPAAHSVPTVFAPADSGMSIEATDHESQFPVGGRLSWPTTLPATRTLSVRVRLLPFA